MRISTPFFQLHSARLVQAIEQGKTRKLLEVMAKDIRAIAPGWQDGSPPIGLRWNMHREFGFPRRPFQLYRRPRRYPMARVVLSSDVPVSGTSTFNFNLGAASFLVMVRVTPAAGQSLVITPLDNDRKPMTIRRQTASAGGAYFLRASHMQHVEVAGQGTVSEIAIVPMQELIDDADWELVQIVGLPFNKGSVGGFGYSGEPQGYVGMLSPPRQAAWLRLTIGALLHLDMPPLGDATVPSPAWLAPDATQYLGYLDSAPDSLLRMVAGCLAACDDSSFDASKRQPAYRSVHGVDGIHQAGISAGDPATAQVPVVGATLLAAGTETYAALAFGFGTTDLPPSSSLRQTTGAPRMAEASSLLGARTATSSRAVVVNPVLSGFDYMVTSKYVIRPQQFLPLPIFDQLSEEIEFAALDDERPMPAVASGLEVFPLRRNRPTARDLKASEALKIRFSRPAMPQGYGLVLSMSAGQSKVLNAPFPFTARSYQTFSTAVIHDVDQLVEPADAGKFLFVEPAVAVPFSGSETHKVFVAGRDVFGRWSDFVKDSVIAAAMPHQLPGILAGQLIPETPVPDATHAQIVCRLEIELGWDYSDRSPAEIQLVGRFFNAGSTPSIVAPATLERVGAASVVASIVFDAAGTPSASLGAITPMTLPPGAPTELRKYLFTLPGFQVVFPSGAPWQVGYALYARAREKVRPATDYSGYTPPFAIRLDDPRPPLVSNLPAEVQYTALPDATRTARGTLKWPAGAGALRYNLWEASETAVRSALEPYLATTFPGNPAKTLLPLTASLVDRATRMRDLLADAATLTQCARAFSKRNRDPISALAYEIELPGSSDGLYLYRISSVNSGNVESGRSSIAFMAVPRLVTPARPRLQLRRHDDASDPSALGVDVRVWQGDGRGPAGFDLYRVRRPPQNSDPGAKGAPLYRSDHVSWAAVSDTQAGKAVTGKRILDQAVGRSWKAYYYQAVAIGHPDPDRGERVGESPGSATEAILLAPESPPSLVELEHHANALSRTVALRSDLPFFPTELGDATIELYSAVFAGGRLERTLLLSARASALAEQASDVGLATTTAQASALPKMQRRATATDGTTRFSVAVKADVTLLIVRVINPLGRSTELMNQA